MVIKLPENKAFLPNRRAARGPRDHSRS